MGIHFVGEYIGHAVALPMNDGWERSRAQTPLHTPNSDGYPDSHQTASTSYSPVEARGESINTDRHHQDWIAAPREHSNPCLSGQLHYGDISVEDYFDQSYDPYSLSLQFEDSHVELEETLHGHRMNSATPVTTSNELHGAPNFSVGSFDPLPDPHPFSHTTPYQPGYDHGQALFNAHHDALSGSSSRQPNIHRVVDQRMATYSIADLHPTWMRYNNDMASHLAALQSDLVRQHITSSSRKAAAPQEYQLYVDPDFYCEKQHDPAYRNLNEDQKMLEAAGTQALDGRLHKVAENSSYGEAGRGDFAEYRRSAGLLYCSQDHAQYSSGNTEH
ncbi:hypothetical protein CBS101457_000157 [Exobasidium rhododendri]|nr:hypothetical protein CBS101457_000157 [Exobasidium rhododendri]